MIPKEWLPAVAVVVVTLVALGVYCFKRKSAARQRDSEQKTDTILVKLYTTSKGGLIRVFREKYDSTTSGFVYRVYWTWNFIMSSKLDCGHPETVEEVETFLEGLANTWKQTFTEIKELGDFPLFYRPKEDDYAVATKQEYGCVHPIKAKDVKKGTYLAGNADSFFVAWKGRDAVENRILVV